MKFIFIDDPKAIQPIIWIKRQPNVFLIHAVRIFSTLPDEPPEDLLPITPPISDVLYYALAGHRFGAPGDQASAPLARYYRALIAQMQMRIEDPLTLEQTLWLHQFQIAHKVVRDFGHSIQPYLGLYDVTKPHCPPHPLHDQRITLLFDIYELSHIMGN